MLSDPFGRVNQPIVSTSSYDEVESKNNDLNEAFDHVDSDTNTHVALILPLWAQKKIEDLGIQGTPRKWESKKGP